MTIDVKLFDDWDAVAADAAGALDRASQPRLFDRLAWHRLIADHCPLPGKPLVARARNGAAASWLFLAAKGKSADAHTNWYSLRFDAAHSRPDETSTKLLEKSANALRRSLDRVQLSPIPGDSPLPAAFRRSGWIVFVAPASAAWDISTAGIDFATYWARRPGRLRNTFKRKAAAAALDIVVHRAFDARAWQAYETVYAQSWKPEEGCPAMLRALAEQEGAAGTLRLGIASKEGRPVAAQLWLVENGEATIHKLAYAEDMKSASPGTILSHAMFREAIDVDRVKRIDFGTGDDGYKRDWMERRTTLIRLTAFNPATIGGLAGAARAAASALVRKTPTG